MDNLFPVLHNMQPRPARPGHRRPHDEPSLNWARAATMRKILPFFVIFNRIRSESKQKSCRIGVRIAHELLEQVSLYKEPSERFFQSKPSSNPSHRLSRCHTIVPLSAPSQPPRKDRRSPPPHLCFPHRQRYTGDPPTPLPKLEEERSPPPAALTTAATSR
jgi:hypothetical protein